MSRKTLSEYFTVQIRGRQYLVTNLFSPLSQLHDVVINACGRTWGKTVWQVAVSGGHFIAASGGCWRFCVDDATSGSLPVPLIAILCLIFSTCTACIVDVTTLMFVVCRVQIWVEIFPARFVFSRESPKVDWFWKHSISMINSSVVIRFLTLSVVVFCGFFD